MDEAHYDGVQPPGQDVQLHPSDDVMLVPGSSMIFSGSLLPSTDRVGMLEQNVSALREDVTQLHKTVMGMQSRIHSLALRALADGVRTKINGGQELTAADKATWNNRVQSGEFDHFGLTRQQLALTKYGDRTIQGAGNAAAHVVSKVEVACAATTFGPDHRALFQFVYGESADAIVFDAEE